MGYGSTSLFRIILDFITLRPETNYYFTIMEAPNENGGDLYKSHPWQFKKTNDGSDTLYNANFRQYYHSIFGAKQETQRVFIELGLHYAFELFDEINILEIGFGTGLNAWATALECTEVPCQVNYTGLEPNPIKIEVINTLNNFSEKEALNGYTSTGLHALPWGERHVINNFFSFEKLACSLQDYQTPQQFNLIYYDAFAPISQPELWTVDIFKKVAELLTPGGILTTYCAKGFVQRNLKAAGFKVERHPGPPRKREVIRAILQ